MTNATTPELFPTFCNFTLTLELSIRVNGTGYAATGLPSYPRLSDELEGDEEINGLNIASILSTLQNVIQQAVTIIAMNSQAIYIDSSASFITAVTAVVDTNNPIVQFGGAEFNVNTSALQGYVTVPVTGVNGTGFVVQLMASVQELVLSADATNCTLTKSQDL